MSAASHQEQNRLLVEGAHGFLDTFPDAADWHGDASDDDTRPTVANFMLAEKNTAKDAMFDFDFADAVRISFGNRILLNAIHAPCPLLFLSPSSDYDRTMARVQVNSDSTCAYTAGIKSHFKHQELWRSRTPGRMLDCAMHHCGGQR